MNRYIRTIVVPSLTFIFGIILQTVVQKWMDTKDTVLLTLLIVVIGLVVLVIIYVYFLSFVDQRFNIIDEMLADVSKRSGLLVEYVEDGSNGKSYQRATEIIRNAEHSLTFVDYWVPYQSYQVQRQIISNSRSEFYAVVRSQIEAHKADRKTFHRRIVQVPRDLMDTHIPFETDPAFFDYLTYASLTQESYPNSCRLKVAGAHIRTHFIMVDERYVVLPILTSDSSTQKQTRHGALFFDDQQGNLIKCLVSIYKVIDAHASPLKLGHSDES